MKSSEEATCKERDEPAGEEKEDEITGYMK